MLGNCVPPGVLDPDEFSLYHQWVFLGEWLTEKDISESKMKSRLRADKLTIG